MSIPSGPHHPEGAEKPPISWYRTTIVIAAAGIGYLVVSGAFAQAYAFLSSASGPSAVPARIAVTAILWAASLAPFLITAARVGRAAEQGADLHRAILSGAATIVRTSLSRSFEKDAQPTARTPGDGAPPSGESEAGTSGWLPRR